MKGLFTILCIHINGFLCCKQKNIWYCRLHFIRMAAYWCRWQWMRALLQLIVIFIPLTTYNYKIKHQNYFFWGPSTQTSTIYRFLKVFRLNHLAIKIYVLSYSNYKYCTIHKSFFSLWVKQTNKENTSLYVWLTCLARSRQACS